MYFTFLILDHKTNAYFQKQTNKKNTQKLFRYTLFKYIIKSYASWMNGQLVK